MKNNSKQQIFFNSIMLDDPNRGCQALTYGSLNFISDYLELQDFEVISPAYYLRRLRKDVVFDIPIKNKVVTGIKRYYWLPTIIIGVVLSKIFGKTIPIGRFGRDFKKIKYVFSIAGGDSFSDIYSSRAFRIVNWVPYVSAMAGKKLIILPQTIGPFEEKSNLKIAETILQKAEKIYVRDLSYADKLKVMKLKYTLNHDVSFFMQLQKIPIEIPQNAVGINISGLLYFNKFHKLAGKSSLYKKLITRIIEIFQKLKVPVVLIPHSYQYENPTDFEDDLLAAQKTYNELNNKDNVLIIDGNYTAPELKYIISQCDYFIGSRMHANFASIYTNVPVFGLAYSYKFAGAFNRYALEGNYEMVLDITDKDILLIIENLMQCYVNRYQTKVKMDNAVRFISK
jgi:polysaccharide pyruvyl transferase WcaK-like protein